MTPGERLHAALGDVTRDTARGAGALDRVRERAHRRRRAVRVWAATTGVAAASLLLVATPLALRADGNHRLEPVTPIPSPTTPPPSPTASPSPSTSPVPQPAGPHEFAAVTDDGDLVLVSAMTGEQVRTITRLDPAPSRIDLAPDGRTIYFAIFPANFDAGEPTPETCPTVYAVDVVSGARRTVTRGYSPVLSPDGSMLAVATCPVSGVGIVGGKTFPLREGVAGGLYDVHSIAWATHGTGLYIHHGGDHANPTVLLDVATDDSADDGENLFDGTDFSNDPVPWHDGTLLMSEVRSYEVGTEFPVSVLDPAGDRDEVLFRLPETNTDINETAIDALIAGPADQVVVQTESWLYRWQGSGAPARIGRPYRVIGW